MPLSRTDAQDTAACQGHRIRQRTGLRQRDKQMVEVRRGSFVHVSRAHARAQTSQAAMGERLA